MVVNDVRKFKRYYQTNEFWEKIDEHNLQFTGIRSLEISQPSRATFVYSLSFALSHMVPNLREIQLSNRDVRRDALRSFCKTCPRLEKVTSSDSFDVYMDGRNMEFVTALKEIVMDCNYFDPGIEREQMSDLNEHPNIFMFHKCSKALERISVRNAKWVRDGTRIPQNSLIKLVRNAPPTMKWFRSDLSEENIHMLRSERPEIELLN